MKPGKIFAVVFMCAMTWGMLLPGCTAEYDQPPRTGTATASLTSPALPANGWGDPGITQSAPPAGWPAGSVAWCCAGGSWWTPIAANAGDTLNAVSMQVQDVAPAPTYISGSAGDGGSTVRLDLVSQVGSTTTTLATGTTTQTPPPTSTGTGLAQAVTLTLASVHVVVAGESLLLKATAVAIYPSSVMHPSVIGPVSAGLLRTLVVPVIGPRIASPIIAQWAVVGGQGSASHWAYVPLTLTVNTTIAAVRARVQDAGAGTTLFARLRAMSDGDETLSVVATSPASGGIGRDETLTIAGPLVVAPTTQYIVEIGNSTNPGNLDSKLFRLEADILN